MDLNNGVFYRRAPRTKQTKKRQPAIRLPSRVMCHLRIWARKQKSGAVEYKGKPVKRVSKAFRRVCNALGLNDVVIHSLRHTAITWAMQRRMDPYEACGYFGLSMEMLMNVYGHHHPDHQTTARRAFDRPARMEHQNVGANVGAKR